jgi:hypothetical protein
MDSDLFLGFILGLMAGVGVVAGAAAVSEALRPRPPRMRVLRDPRQEQNGRPARPVWPTRPPR